MLEFIGPFVKIQEFSDQLNHCRRTSQVHTVFLAFLQFVHTVFTEKTTMWASDCRNQFLSIGVCIVILHCLLPEAALYRSHSLR